MKKVILSVVLMFALMLSMGTGAFALANEPEIMPLYNYTIDYDVALSASGSTLTGTANLTGYQGTTTQVDAVMTLQKKGLLRWNDASTDYTYTMYSYYANAQNTYTVGSGTYRLKVVFTVYSGSASETITAYSDTLKI